MSANKVSNMKQLIWNICNEGKQKGKIRKLVMMLLQKISKFNPFQSSVTFDIETSPLIYSPNEINGFYRYCNTGLK